MIDHGSTIHVVVHRLQCNDFDLDETDADQIRQPESVDCQLESVSGQSDQTLPVECSELVQVLENAPETDPAEKKDLGLLQ